MSDMQYLAPNGVGQAGTTEAGVRTGGVQQIPFRDMRDAQMSGMSNFVPSEQFPSGYLGTIQSRREDRFLDNLKNQLNQRSYTRGVHMGEKIDARDYFWPSELQPDRGLLREARGVLTDDGTIAVKRFTPLGTPLEQIMASDGAHIPIGPRGKMGPLAPIEINPTVVASMRSLGPSWS